MGSDPKRRLPSIGIQNDDGFGILTFVVLLALVANTTGIVIGQAFANRTTNQGFNLLELITFRIVLTVTAIGVVLSLVILQRLLVKELLTYEGDQGSDQLRLT